MYLSDSFFNQNKQIENMESIRDEGMLIQISINFISLNFREIKGYFFNLIPI